MYVVYNIILKFNIYGAIVPIICLVMSNKRLQVV